MKGKWNRKKKKKRGRKRWKLTMGYGAERPKEDVGVTGHT